MSAIRYLRPAIIRVLFKTFGLRGLARRAIYEFRRRTNNYKSAPAGHRNNGENHAAFRYRPQSPFTNLEPALAELAIRRGRQVVNGQFQAYGDRWMPLPKNSGDWHTHPESGYQFSADSWWKVPHLPAGADIKDVWEPARFSWVYDLVRAFAVSGDEAYANAFFAYAGAWCDANPPFLGAHWSCGQETAIRVLAILHGIDSLPGHVADEPNISRLEEMLGWSGERIADAIGYGLSQRNNHGISESAALVHLGLRLAGIHPSAKRWLSTGIRCLNEQICDQFSEDGWYAQHSFIYMRVALEQALYAHWVLRASGLGLAAESLDRLGAAMELLMLLVNPQTGIVPNHGANDGARVLPLAPTDHRDFRPVLTLAAIVLDRPLVDGLPPDPFTVKWLGAVPRSERANDKWLNVGASGWVVAQNARYKLFLFAGCYRHRPSHLDQLHVHLSCSGREIITDAGTYSYNRLPPWNNGLVTSFVHNGPVLNGREAAERGPRFLWLAWPRAKVVTATQSPDTIRIVAERDGQVRREIILGPHRARIIDRSIDATARELQVTWLVHPDSAGLCSVSAVGANEVEVSDDQVVGWFSPTYGRKHACRALRVVRNLDAGCDGRQASIETSIEIEPDTGTKQE